MDVISYNQVENDLKVSGKFSFNFEQEYQKVHFDKNPSLTRYISKLSDQYNRYKEIFIFPTKYKGRTNFKKKISIVIVKLGSLVSLTEWSNISERNSKLIENLKKGPELTL